MTVKQFMAQQPGYPEVAITDKYYYVVAVHLCRAWDKCGVLTSLDDEVRVRVVLALIGYYQDVVADAGLWRTFTSQHEAQFGSPLPHYKRSEDYVDYELNIDDLRYLIWYTLDYSMDNAPQPHDESIMALAHAMHVVLDYDYEHAPVPVELTMLTSLDLNDENDRMATYDLAHWFYWRSYLMQRNALDATAQAMPQARAIIEQCGEGDASPMLHDLNDRIMASRPAVVGPISMPLSQWLQLITDHEL